MTISIWLVSQENQEVQLRKIINDLASRYGAFSFVPHITAYHFDNVRDLNEVMNQTKEIAGQSLPFSLDLESVSYSDIFTKTLYAQYKINSHLKNLYEQFRKRFFDQFPYEINPHLSLIYKNNMSEIDKKKEINRILVPKQINLDRLIMIARDGSIKQEKDVLDWKNVAEFKLGKS